jgi:hypothetical protein
MAYNENISRIKQEIEEKGTKLADMETEIKANEKEPSEHNSEDGSTHTYNLNEQLEKRVKDLEKETGSLTEELKEEEQKL